jgi:hypothetical protein
MKLAHSDEATHLLSAAICSQKLNGSLTRLESIGRSMTGVTKRVGPQGRA